MDIKKTIQSDRGTLTYAHVDGPDDVWFWAIVSGYKGCQDYDEVVVAFADGYEPNAEAIPAILRSLEDCRTPPAENPWTEDPEYPKEDWEYEVANGDTRLGYQDWVSHQRESNS